MYSTATTIRFYANRASAGLAAIIALSALLYGVFLLLAVTHTASRARAESDIGKLTASLATLQETYLVLERQITPSRAEALGLVKPASSATVFADASAPTLTLLPAPRALRQAGGTR